MKVYVLYAYPRDYPDEWVVRGQEAIGPDRIVCDPEPIARGSTRDECVEAFYEALPAAYSMAWLNRHPDDELQIVGTWI